MRKQVEMVEVKGSGFTVDNVEWGTYIPESELKNMKQEPKKRIYNWKPFIIPGTPCPMIGKNYRELQEVQSRLMDTYPEYEFCLKGIAPATWQMMYSL